MPANFAGAEFTSFDLVVADCSERCPAGLFSAVIAGWAASGPTVLHPG